MSSLSFGHTGGMRLLAVPHDSRKIAVWRVDEIKTSKQELTVITLVPEGQRITAFSMAGLQLAVGSADGALVVHTISIGACVATAKIVFVAALPAEAPHRYVQAVKFGPGRAAGASDSPHHNQRLVAASWGTGNVRVFGVESSACMMEFLHHGQACGGWGLIWV